MSEHPRLLFDFGSPYAYLAVERAEAVLTGPVELQPVLLGAIFKHRGWGSWALTDEREHRVREIEQRARRYGLPPINWPLGWPSNSLAADRAAVWAGREGMTGPYVRAVFRRQFVDGADITRFETLAAAAEEVGMDPNGLKEALQSQEIKDALRQATDEAWRAGVHGVPATLIAGKVFYGDDQLEQAALSQAEQRAGR